MPVIDANYELRWPVQLLREQLSHELNNRDDPQWDDRVRSVVMDAFTTAVPLQDFNATTTAWPPPSGALSAPQAWVARLLRDADRFPTLDTRRPYYSTRHALRSPSGLMDLRATVQAFDVLFDELEGLGYFEEAWEKRSCPDVRDAPDPAHVIAGRVHHDHAWPIDIESFVWNKEYFFDLVEVLYDLVSSPTRRYNHSFDNCGPHALEFDRARGRAVYAWRVNRLLKASDLGLLLATDGEDAGRLVNAAEPGLTDLVEQMASDAADTSSGQVQHAIALYRARDSSPHQKRSAVVALALVLEERRALLKAKLYRKDEGALFQIANEFAVRHQDAKQQSDFDPAFYDWFFAWYLATIQLTDRINERAAEVEEPPF